MVRQIHQLLQRQQELIALETFVRVEDWHQHLFLLIQIVPYIQLLIFLTMVKVVYTVHTIQPINQQLLELFLKYQQSIIDSNLQDNFFLLNGIFSFAKIIENSDIVLRPTHADGDAITIREALFLGKLILASDIVQRPQGTLLFKTRDQEDFYLQLSSLLNGFQSSSILSSTDIDLITSEYRKCYSGIINSVLNS